MIKQFDKSNLRELRTDLDAALATVAKKHGISILVKNINYYAPDFISAKTTLEFTALGDANAAIDPRAVKAAKQQSDFKLYASSFGLQPEQYGAIFKVGGDAYKLVALNPRAPKNPVHGANVRTGKVYIFPERAILGLQSDEHKEMFGLGTKATTAAGMCSSDNAYDNQFNPIGKCNRPATTQRKDGFGRTARMQPFCEQCASVIDESRAEMAAEARMS